MLNKYHIRYYDGNAIQIYKVIAESKQNAYRRFLKVFNSKYKVLEIINYTKQIEKQKKLFFNFFITCVVVFLVTIILYQTFKTPDPVRYEEYTVDSADTIWNIAKMSDGWNKLDNSDVIADIYEKSNCSANIEPGDIIYIPFYN